MRLKIKVSPDGKEVTGLYSDSFPWYKLGKLKVERASDIFFGSSSQRWEIKLSTGEVLPLMFVKRKDAIAYEIAYLQGQL